MLGRIDVRRTEGGLRLLVQEVGVLPRRSVRLSYAQAGDLIAAIKVGELHSEAGAVTLAPDAQRADTASAGPMLAKACAGTFLREQDLDALGDALSAHMPDRMIPLPNAQL